MSNSEQNFWLDVVDSAIYNLASEAKRNLETARQISSAVIHLSEAVKGLHGSVEDTGQKITLTNLSEQDIENIKKVLTPNTEGGAQ